MAETGQKEEEKKDQIEGEVAGEQVAAETELDKAIVPHSQSLSTLTFTDIQNMGDVFYKSGMFKDVGTAAQAVVKVLAGHELGLGAVYSMQRLYMVDGKLGMAAETMAALLKRGGKYNYRVKEHTDKKCSIIFYENGEEAYVSTFTIEDARKANLIKPNGGWTKYPRALLFSRALSQGARIVAPDAIGGAYTEEELRSIKVTSVPKDAPAAEGTNQKTGEGGEVIEGQYSEVPEGSGNPYMYLLEKCPEHDVEWRVNKWGQSYHRDGEAWCNFVSNKEVRDVLKAKFIVVGFTNDDVNPYCKSRFEKPFSKLTAEEGIAIIWDFEKMAENPVLLEAAKLAIGKEA